MTASTTSKTKKILPAILAALFWVAVWQALAMLIGEELFLASPVKVLTTLWGLLGTSEFYATVGFSLLRITVGFLIGAAIGSAMAVAAYKLRLLETLFRPLMGAVKAAPVASFVVLAILLVGSENLSALIALLMVAPVFYSNVLAGLQSVLPERFDAAEVFGMLPTDRFRFIYLPFVTPFVKSACEVGIGIAWKAGVSAEVIGIAAGTIGGKIYDAKINLDTAELLAYTLVVVLISLLLEKLAKHIIDKAADAMTR